MLATKASRSYAPTGAKRLDYGFSTKYMFFKFAWGFFLTTLKNTKVHVLKKVKISRNAL